MPVASQRHAGRVARRVERPVQQPLWMGSRREYFVPVGEDVEVQRVIGAVAGKERMRAEQSRLLAVEEHHLKG